MLSLLRRSFVTLVFLPGLGLLALLLAARLGTWARPAPLEVLDTFALYAFAPFLAVAVAAVVFWSRALTVLVVLAALFFVQQFGGPVLSALSPSSSAALAAPVPGASLRILTFNLHSPNDDPAPLIAAIRETRPDIVALQEVTETYARSLDRAIAASYPFSVTAGLDTAHDGSATWSRVPLLEREAFRLSPWGNVLHRVRVSTDAGDLWLYNVHLPNPLGEDRHETTRSGRLAVLRRFDGSRRDFELERLAQQTAALDAPFILAGDFNSAAGSRPARAFPAHWRDAFGVAGAGFGHTFPAPRHQREGGSRLQLPFPLIRIDYILTGPALQPVRAWTAEVGGSDHLAVIADVALPPTR